MAWGKLLGKLGVDIAKEVLIEGVKEAVTQAMISSSSNTASQAALGVQNKVADSLGNDTWGLAYGQMVPILVINAYSFKGTVEQQNNLAEWSIIVGELVTYIEYCHVHGFKPKKSQGNFLTLLTDLDSLFASGGHAWTLRGDWAKLGEELMKWQSDAMKAIKADPKGGVPWPYIRGERLDKYFTMSWEEIEKEVAKWPMPMQRAWREKNKDLYKPVSTPHVPGYVTGFN